MTLSPAATIVLTRAAERPDRLLEFSHKLPTFARHKMIDAMLRDGVIAETQGDYRLGDASTLKLDAATGLMLTTLTITDDGFRAIGKEPPVAAAVADTAPHAASDAAVAKEAAAIADALDAATDAPTANPGRNTLRHAAAAVLAAWDDQDNRDTDMIAALEAPMTALRALLADKAPRAEGAPRKPREGTKQEAVLTMLRRSEGATVAQIAETTGWASHTVRGFLAGLKKKGITITALERVKMVGPNKEGAKGSYTIYATA